MFLTKHFNNFLTWIKKGFWYYCFKNYFLTNTIKISKLHLIYFRSKNYSCIGKHDICFIKQRKWKPDIAKIVIVINWFRKTLHCRCLTSFWIYQGSECGSCFEYARAQGLIYQCTSMPLVLNIEGLFWIYEGSEYAIVTHSFDHAWICLNIPNMSEYAGISVNMSKSLWISFAWHFPVVIPSLLELVITYFSVTTKLEVIVWRNTRLFPWRDKISFSLKYLEVIDLNFVLRLNIFRNKISNLPLLLGVEGPGAMNLDIPTIKSWTTTEQWNQINKGQFTNPATSIIPIKLI